jgi:hypothetical protein
MNTPQPADPQAALQVACLCAAWCRTCDAYAAVFEQAMAALRLQHPGLQAHWIDIEDEAELLGELDIETFPTLVVIDASRVRFAGTLTPQPQTLQRVLRAALEDTTLAGYSTEVLAFAERLRLRTRATPTHQDSA